MSEELQEIERLTLLNGGTKSFDTWGDSVRTMIYFYLIHEFHEKGLNFFSGRNGDYIVFYREGKDSKGGMYMGSPNSMVVKIVKKWS